jgi:hypothetical protein
VSGGKAIAERPEAAVQGIDLKGVADAMAQFEKFKKDILIPSVDTWTDRDGKPHVRKPGWMKYAMALGISTDFYDETHEVIRFGGVEVMVFHCTGKATAPNGRHAVAAGSASSDEGKPWAKTLHGIRAMAQTRAVLRAVSNLVGGGEVSAEELDTADVQEPRKFAVNVSSPASGGVAALVGRDRGAKLVETPDGNERDPATLWRDIFAESGVSAETVELLEMVDLGGYRMSIKPTRFLGDLWVQVNDVVRAHSGQWVQAPDKKDNHWEVTY